jgi:hypothetical protein
MEQLAALPFIARLFTRGKITIYNERTFVLFWSDKLASSQVAFFEQAICTALIYAVLSGKENGWGSNSGRDQPICLSSFLNSWETLVFSIYSILLKCTD